MPKKKEERWQDSKAKQVLKADIMSKMVLPTTKPKIVYSLSVNGKYFFKRLHTELINDKYIFLL